VVDWMEFVYRHAVGNIPRFQVLRLLARWVLVACLCCEEYWAVVVGGIVLVVGCCGGGSSGLSTSRFCGEFLDIKGFGDRRVEGCVFCGCSVWDEDCGAV